MLNKNLKYIGNFISLWTLRKEKSNFQTKHGLKLLFFVYLDAWTFLLSFRELSRKFADKVESFRDNESACCTFWRTADNGFSATLKWLWWWQFSFKKKGNVGGVVKKGVERKERKAVMRY